MPRRPSPASSHARTRRDHASEMAEDYVEAIAEVVRLQGECRVVDLARRFGVTHVTVSRTTRRLVRDGLIETQPYGPILLTAEGRRLARLARERHEVVYRFLRVLGVSEPAAEVDAEGIEHHCSQETLLKMKQFIAEQTPAVPAAVPHDSGKSAVPPATGRRAAEPPTRTPLRQRGRPAGRK